MPTTNDELKTLITDLPKNLRGSMEEIAEKAADKAIAKHYRICKNIRDKESGVILIPKKSIAEWIKIGAAVVGLLASGAGLQEVIKLIAGAG